MSLRNDLAYVRDIWETVTEALSFVEGCTREEYLSDLQLQRALQRDLEIVGEAANHVGPEFRLDHPEIPWDVMRGTRNRLIHAYRDVRLGNDLENGHRGPAASARRDRALRWSEKGSAFNSARRMKPGNTDLPG